LGQKMALSAASAWQATQRPGPAHCGRSGSLFFLFGLTVRGYRTVGWHLGNVFTKLGITSRIDLR